MTNTVKTNYISEINELIDADGVSTFFIQFPEEMLTQLGWKEGDVLDWEVFNEFATITKK